VTRKFLVSRQLEEAFEELLEHFLCLHRALESREELLLVEGERGRLLILSQCHHREPYSPPSEGDGELE
jgi:hypothetical protein